MEPDPYLAHYGVLGMRWGHRKTDRVRTGKSKYLSNRDQKLYNRIQSRKKSRRQLKLERNYQNQGLSKAEAAIQAYKRVKAERILLATAGVTVTAIAAYAAYKHYDSVTDRILNSGDLLGRMDADNNKGVKDAFYAFNNQYDKGKYTGLYGHQLAEANKHVYRKSIRVGGSPIKVASRESSKRALKEMAKNAENQTLFDKLGKKFAFLPGDIKKLKSGNIDDSLYDRFNQALVVHNDSDLNAVHKNFYSQLKKMGYGALQDVNDQDYSGYRARNPLIIFDNSKVNVEKVEEIGRDYINQQYFKKMGQLAAEHTFDGGTRVALIAGTPLAALNLTKRKASTSAVIAYRKRHPETKKTSQEIEDMLSSGKIDNSGKSI